MAAVAAAPSLYWSAMEDIINAFPEAATQISNMVSALFASGIATIIVPFVLVELIVLVFGVIRGGKAK